MYSVHYIETGMQYYVGLLTKCYKLLWVIQFSEKLQAYEQ